MDKMEEGGVCNTSDQEKVEPDQVKLQSRRYSFGTWQYYSKQMANGKSTESVQWLGKTSSKCSVEDWKNEFR